MAPAWDILYCSLYRRLKNVTDWWLNRLNEGSHKGGDWRYEYRNCVGCVKGPRSRETLRERLKEGVALWGLCCAVQCSASDELHDPPDLLKIVTVRYLQASASPDVGWVGTYC